MSEEVTIEIPSGDDEVEAVVEAVEDVAETVAEAVVDAVEAVAGAFTDEGQHSENVALLVGGIVTTLDALIPRVEALEARTNEATAIAETAIAISVDALDEASTIVEPEPEQEAIVEDEAPPTKRQSFGQWFFGKPKSE